MALTFDRNGLPACCGLGLVPGEPHTACPLCAARYDTQQLAERIRLLKTIGPHLQKQPAAPVAMA